MQLLGRWSGKFLQVAQCQIKFVVFEVFFCIGSKFFLLPTVCQANETGGSSRAINLLSCHRKFCIIGRDMRVTSRILSGLVALAGILGPQALADRYADYWKPENMAKLMCASVHIGYLL